MRNIVVSMPPARAARRPIVKRARRIRVPSGSLALSNDPITVIVPTAVRRSSFANWYVSKAGSDSNSGTSSNSAFLTISKAVSSVSAGEIIEVEAGTYNEQIKPTVGGTDGNEITLRSKPGDAVRIYAPAGVGGTFEADGLAYWILQGDPDDRSLLKLGNADNEWILADDGGRSVTSDGNINFINGSNHIDVQNVTIYGGRSLGASHLNRIYSGTNVCRFKNCNFTLGGSNADPNHINEAERGDLVHARAYDILFEDCSFSLGGHDLWVLHGHHFVMRRCVSDGDWSNAPAFTDVSHPGQRCGALSTARHDRAPAPYGPNLFEDYIIKNANASGDQSQQSGHKCTGTNNILRKGYYWDNQADPFSSALAAAGDPYPVNINSDLRMYHCTFYNNGTWLRSLDSATTEPNQQRDFRFKNIITVEMTGVMKSGNQADVPSGDPAHIFADHNSLSQQEYNNDWIGWHFDGIRFHSGTVDAVNIFLRTDAEETVAGAPTRWPANFGTLYDGNASFIDVSARTKGGFALADGSPDIGAAEPLTQVATTASNATSIQLDDVKYFYDGFNLGYFGEVGDYIKIVPSGQNPVNNGTIVQIQYQGRNSANNTLALTSAVSVTAGDDVYWVEPDGTTLADNLGAAQ